MLTLHGQLLQVLEGTNTNRESGEISKKFTAEVLHQSRNRFEVVAVTLDESGVVEWHKAINKHITCEVRPYAIKTREGGILSGLTLADKKCLPVIQPEIRLQSKEAGK